MPTTFDAVFSATHLHGRRSGRDSGMNPFVREKVMQCHGAVELLNKVVSTVLRLAANKDDVIVAVGCNNGKHRSVTIVVEARMLLDQISIWIGSRPMSVMTWHLARSRW